MTEPLSSLPVTQVAGAAFDRARADDAARASGFRRQPDIELEAAIERLGGNPQVYHDVFPVLRSNAACLIAVASTLVADNLRRDAALMFRTLRSIADAMGAAALSRVAREAESLMASAPTTQDGHVVGQVSLALITCSTQIERALRALERAEADHEGAGARSNGRRGVRA
jgi:hypothetical protein